MITKISKLEGVKTLAKTTQKEIKGGFVFEEVCGPEDLACIGFDILKCVDGRWRCVANPNDPNNPQES
ncbi:hypothetical protein [Aquimarina rhabdastrellae]